MIRYKHQEKYTIGYDNETFQNYANRFMYKFVK